MYFIVSLSFDGMGVLCDACTFGIDLTIFVHLCKEIFMEC